MLKDCMELEKVLDFFQGWLSYITHADTYKCRKHITRILNKCFPIKTEAEMCQ